MKTIFITLIITFSSIFTYGKEQDAFYLFDSLAIEAYRAFSEKNYQTAFDYYVNAFEFSDGESRHYLNAALCAYHIDKPKKVIAYLGESIMQTGIDIDEIFNFSEFFKEEKYKKYLNKNQKALTDEFYLSRKNLQTYISVEKLKVKDQFSRNLKDYYNGISQEYKTDTFYKYFEARENKDTVLANKYRDILFPKTKNESLKLFSRKIMQTTDSLNILKLIKITKKDGWQSNAWLLLWHQRGSYGKKTFVWDFFVPYINQVIKEYKVRKSFWAPFEDFKSIRENGYSKYGYHPGKVDPEQVNKFRKSINLPMLIDSEIQKRNDNPYSGVMQ